MQLMQLFASHLLHIELIKAVDCGLVECCPTPLQWLCKVAGYWQELEHAVLLVNPEHSKPAQWVTCLVIMQDMEEHKTGTFSASRDCLQILATWGCALS
jgi:hypothetical protein